MNAPEAPLSVSLTLTPELAKGLERETGALEVARAYVIDSPEIAQAANDELKDVKKRLKAVEGWRERFLAPVRQLQETAAEFCNPAIESLTDAEAHLKTALLGWQQKEEERAAEARRQAEEAARKARQEAEAKAAAERARAEEAAREARRKAQEAEAARVKALAEGNAKAAAAAAAAAARATEQAQAAIENGEAKANQATMEAAAVSVLPTASVTKLSGFTSRDNWIAELAAPEDEAKLLVVKAIAEGRSELLGLLSLDLKAANKLAKALKANFNVLGLKARNAPVAASRG